MTQDAAAAGWRFGDNDPNNNNFNNNNNVNDINAVASAMNANPRNLRLNTPRKNKLSKAAAPPINLQNKLSKSATSSPAPNLTSRLSAPPPVLTARSSASTLTTTSTSAVQSQYVPFRRQNQWVIWNHDDRKPLDEPHKVSILRANWWTKLVIKNSPIEQWLTTLKVLWSRNTTPTTDNLELKASYSYPIQSFINMMTFAELIGVGLITDIEDATSISKRVLAYCGEYTTYDEEAKVLAGLKFNDHMCT